MLKLRGKRWLYEIGGRRMSVENAWNLTGWAQERVVIDGESVRTAGGEFSMRREFTIPVTETRLNAPLHITLYSRLFSVDCIVSYGDQVVEPKDIQFGNWRGRRGDWPPSHLPDTAEPAGA